jgi:hypothetical protein
LTVLLDTGSSRVNNQTFKKCVFKTFNVSFHKNVRDFCFLLLHTVGKGIPLRKRVLTIIATAIFTHHLTASGHIEPGSSGSMRPGRATAYPSSPTPHHSCCRALDTLFIDIISFNIVCVAWQVGN